MILSCTLLRTLSVALSAVACVMSSRAVAAQAASLTVSVENPLAIARNDETISLAWPTLQAKLPGVAAARVRD